VFITLMMFRCRQATVRVTAPVWWSVCLCSPPPFHGYSYLAVRLWKLLLLRLLKPVCQWDACIFAFVLVSFCSFTCLKTASVSRMNRAAVFSGCP
jgi:hypothetical protein